MKYRIEKDTLGEVKIPIESYWGPQTQRSINNFKIGNKSTMPIEIIYGFATLKKAAAYANHELQILTLEKRNAISKVCDEIIDGKLDSHFPLVISNRAHILEGKKIGEGENMLNPNDDVNKSQSSNDTFPTAMHIAAYNKIVKLTIPALEDLRNSFDKKTNEFKKIIKIGRTHFMDATPLSLGQEFSGYVSQIDHGIEALKNTLPHLSEIALGGTAVGTGINTPNGYDKLVASYIKKFTGLPFITSKNKFESIAAHDAIVETHGALKQIAMSLYKIANDIRMLSSGPRSGIGEIILPSNEPGSSIMPGKINPTQCEALTMVCAQITR